MTKTKKLNGSLEKKDVKHNFKMWLKIISGVLVLGIVVVVNYFFPFGDLFKGSAWIPNGNETSFYYCKNMGYKNTDDMWFYSPCYENQFDIKPSSDTEITFLFTSPLPQPVLDQKNLPKYEVKTGKVDLSSDNPYCYELWDGMELNLNYDGIVNLDPNGKDKLVEYTLGDNSDKKNLEVQMSMFPPICSGQLKMNVEKLNQKEIKVNNFDLPTPVSYSRVLDLSKIAFDGVGEYEVGFYIGLLNNEIEVGKFKLVVSEGEDGQNSEDSNDLCGDGKPLVTSVVFNPNNFDFNLTGQEKFETKLAQVTPENPCFENVSFEMMFGVKSTADDDKVKWIKLNDPLNQGYVGLKDSDQDSVNDSLIFDFSNSAFIQQLKEKENDLISVKFNLMGDSGVLGSVDFNYVKKNDGEDKCEALNNVSLISDQNISTIYIDDPKDLKLSIKKDTNEACLIGTNNIKIIDKNSSVVLGNDELLKIEDNFVNLDMDNMEATLRFTEEKFLKKFKVGESYRFVFSVTHQEKEVKAEFEFKIEQKKIVENDSGQGGGGQGGGGQGGGQGGGGQGGGQGGGGQGGGQGGGGQGGGGQGGGGQGGGGQGGGGQGGGGQGGGGKLVGTTIGQCVVNGLVYEGYNLNDEKIKVVCENLKSINSKLGNPIFLSSLPLNTIENRINAGLVIERVMLAFGAKIQAKRLEVAKLQIEKAGDAAKLKLLPKGKMTDLVVLVQKNILRGRGKSVFAPDDAPTKWEMLALFYQTAESAVGKMKLDEMLSKYFDKVPVELDQPDREWLKNSCAIGLAMKMINSCPLGAFSTNLTREEFISFIAKIDVEFMNKLLK